MAEELNNARKKLFEKLGDKTKSYCQIMKQWFSMKLTKDEFDMEVRKMMTLEQTRLHNEFLLCLFNKCNFNSNDNVHTRLNNKRAKISKSKRNSDKGMHQAVDSASYLPPLEAPPQHLQDYTQRYCAQEYFLPDLSLIMGRLKLGAWELGMDDADDSAAELLVTAVQFFLKNILTAIFTQKSSYKVHERRIIHSVGRPVPSPWLVNTMKAWKSPLAGPMHIYDGEDGESYRVPKTNQEREQKEIHEIGCSTTAVDPPPKLPVSVYDLFNALMVHKSVIPAHSTYAANMERIIASLSHPSWDDLNASREFKT